MKMLNILSAAKNQTAMKQRNTMNAAKIIACILIVSFLMNSTMAAPLADNQQRQTGSQEKQNRKNAEHRKIGFSNKDVEMWTNPCNADSIVESNNPVVDPSSSFETNFTFYSQLKVIVGAIDSSLNESNKINTTNYKAWSLFNEHMYEFLPEKPTGNHRRWHFDMQKYVASFILLHKNQKLDEGPFNNNTMSSELWNILKDARNLLCEIEHFVNATSSQKIGSNDWIKKREMRDIIQFQNLTSLFIHRTFTKGRFQDYVKKLLNRISQQSERKYVEKQVTYPKFKSIKKNKQGTKRARKGNRRNQNGRKLNQQYEVSTTKRVHIVRTSKMPAQQPRNNKNKNNRRRQRTKTTTTTTAASV